MDLCSIVSCTNELTLWNTVLLDKPVVVQLVQRLAAFYGNPEVHYSVHNSQPLSTIPSQINPLLNFPFYFTVLLNVNIPPMPSCSK